MSKDGGERWCCLRLVAHNYSCSPPATHDIWYFPRKKRGAARKTCERRRTQDVRQERKFNFFWLVSWDFIFIPCDRFKYFWQIKNPSSQQWLFITLQQRQILSISTFSSCISGMGWIQRVILGRDIKRKRIMCSWLVIYGYNLQRKLNCFRKCFFLDSKRWNWKSSSTDFQHKIGFYSSLQSP